MWQFDQLDVLHRSTLRLAADVLGGEGAFVHLIPLAFEALQARRRGPEGGSLIPFVAIVVLVCVPVVIWLLWSLYESKHEDPRRAQELVQWVAHRYGMTEEVARENLLADIRSWEVVNGPATIKAHARRIRTEEW